MRLKNNYFILRHGETISIKGGFVSCWPEKRHNPLTAKGRKQIQKIIPKFKKEKIDLIFSSDILRCKQAARIVAERLNLKVIFDRRLREVNLGIFNGKPVKEWNAYFKNRAEKFIKRAPGAENRRDIKRRLVNFMRSVDKKYRNKNILIISHEDPLIILQGAVRGLTKKEVIRQWEKFKINTGEYRPILR